MIFLRPVVLKNADAAATASPADRYDYIRDVQDELTTPGDLLLPDEAADEACRRSTRPTSNPWTR